MRLPSWLVGFGLSENFLQPGRTGGKPNSGLARILEAPAGPSDPMSIKCQAVVTLDQYLLHAIIDLEGSNSLPSEGKVMWRGFNEFRDDFKFAEDILEVERC